VAQLEDSRSQTETYSTCETTNLSVEQEIGRERVKFDHLRTKR